MPSFLIFLCGGNIEANPGTEVIILSKITSPWDQMPGIDSETLRGEIEPARRDLQQEDYGYWWKSHQNIKLQSHPLII